MRFKDNVDYIGKLSGTHGIKGELKLYLDQNSTLNGSLNDKNVFLIENENIDTMVVERFYLKSNKNIIKFKNFDNINDVIKFSKLPVYISKEEKLVTKVKTYLECSVVSKSKTIGKVVEIINNGVYDLIKIETVDNSFWIPVVDKFIENIDLELNKIIVKNIEELF